MKEKIDYTKEGVNLAYDSLFFEITRKCNLKCEHCMRGKAQNITMSKEIIDNVLDQIWYVKDINITGGEPFLAPDELEYLIDGIIKRKMRFAHFQLVVNGTILDDRAIKCINSINKLASYMFEELYSLAYKTQKDEEYLYEKDYGNNPDKEKPISLSVSVDEFHNNKPDMAYEFYKKYANNKYIDVKKQNMWTRVIDGEEITMEQAHELIKEKGATWICDEGNAAKNNIGYHKSSCEHCANVCHRVKLEDGCLQCRAQICANGNFVLGEELSFDNLDKFSMGNVLNRPISCMIIDWQWKEPLECDEVYDMFRLKSLIDYDKFNDDSLNINTKDKDIQDVLQCCVDMILLKRELLKMAHEKFPFLKYEDIVDVVDADLNIRTDGLFAKYMRIYYEKYKEKYPDSWQYNFITEQTICNNGKIANAIGAFIQGKGFFKTLFGELKWEDLGK